MLEFTVGGINLLPFMEPNYTVDISEQTGTNGFVADNGDIISDKIGDMITITASLIMVPIETAKAIESVMHSGNFEGTISTPCLTSAVFHTTSYKAMERKMGQYWNIRFTIAASSLINTGDRL